MKFVNREEELDSLIEAYDSKVPNLVVIYGRRRIGKTALIKKFGEKVNFAYYLCDTAPISEQLRRLSLSIGLAINDKELAEMGVASFEALFYRIARLKIDKKLVIVFDEFQNLARLENAIPSIFQRGWDEYLSKSNVMLILAGSSISMMRNEVLSYSAPLYGRSTQIFELKPLRPKHAFMLMPESMSMKEKLYLYFMLGGVPAYYANLEGAIADYENASIDEILLAMVKEGSVFASEPNILLSEETKNDTKYLQILDLIANGVNKPSEIASKIGIAHANLGKYMGVLEYIGMVEKEVPVNLQPLRKSKIGIYKINDNFTYFYFRTLKKALPSKNVQYLHDDLDLLSQSRFEYFAKDFLLELSINKKIFGITKMGRWWGRDPSKPKDMNQEEIDVVALNEKSNDILFAECKWTSKPIGVEVYMDLKRKSRLVQWHNNERHEHYALFSKSGFSEEMRSIAEKEHVLLFDLEVIEKVLQ
jgi:AAA+ ATPase superfamily predicted ATPase